MPALVAAGLAAHALATWRALALLAGAGALPGYLVAGLVLLAYDAPLPRPAPRPGAIAAALAVLLGALGAPVVGSAMAPGLLGGLLAALLLVAPALLVPRSDEGRPVALLVGGGGLAVASFALPFTGPLMISVAAALLVACGAMAGLTDEKAAGRSGTSALLSVVAGLGCGAAMARLVADGSHPWPGLPLRLAALLAAAGLGALLVGRLTPKPVRAAAAAVGALLVGILTVLPSGGEALDSLLARVATNASHPAVGAMGGALTLLAAALLLGAPTGLLAGLSSIPRTRLSAGIAAAAAIAGMLIAARLASDEGGWPGHEVNRGVGPAGSKDRWVTLDGHLAAWRTASRERDDRLAAHLAALATPARRRALVLGFDPGPSVEALALHGFTSLEIARLARSKDGYLPPPTAEARTTRIAGPTDLEALGPYDAIVSELDDPSLPSTEAFFTRQAREIVRERLVPGGVFAQRLSLERLGPEGLIRQVMALEEVFPGVHLATADLGRGGTVIALCTRATEPEQRRGVPTPKRAAPAPPSAPLVVDGTGKAPRIEGEVILPTKESAPAADQPWLSINLLTGEDRLTPRVAGDLARSLVLGRDGVIETIAAGPAELAALTPGLVPADPWRPRGDAFRHPAPPDVARELAQSLLYDRIPVVDVRMAVAPRVLSGDWPRAWPLVEVEERLSPDWHAQEAELRQSNQIARAFGGVGAWRERGRRLRFAAPGRTLDVYADERPAVTEAGLIASMAAFEGESLKHSGQGLVHGHRFFWMFEEPDAHRQEITLSWYCPEQGRLYLEEMVVTEGVRPGYYEDGLRELVEGVRCVHEEATAQAKPQ
jgi:hypothetical protein